MRKPPRSRLSLQLLSFNYPRLLFSSLSCVCTKDVSPFVCVPCTASSRGVFCTQYVKMLASGGDLSPGCVILSCLSSPVMNSHFSLAWESSSSPSFNYGFSLLGCGRAYDFSPCKPRRDPVRPFGIAVTFYLATFGPEKGPPPHLSPSLFQRILRLKWIITRTFFFP